MKHLRFVAFGMIVVSTAYAQVPQAANDLENAIRTGLSELVQIQKDIDLIEVSNKKIAQSNQTQLDTTAMLNKTEHRIRDIDIPVLQRKFEDIKSRAQALLDSGCAVDRTYDPDLARRCNEGNDKLRSERILLAEEEQNLIRQAKTVGEIRQAVSNTTFQNAALQKKNNDQFESLGSKKTLVKSSLISLIVADRSKKASAYRACSLLYPLEKAVCCQNVVFDNYPPRLCEVEAIFVVFERAGLFSTSEIRLQQ